MRDLARSATAPERLFALLRGMQAVVADVSDVELRGQLAYALEAALSWESLVVDREAVGRGLRLGRWVIRVTRENADA